MFTETWFDADAQATLAVLAESVTEVPGLIVEIGAWEGRSTVVLANAVAPRVVHSVDTWLGSDSDESGVLAAERDVFAAWSSNVASMTAGNVIPHHCDWREWVAGLNQPVALCFIDAEHTYTEVFDNITAVLPFVSSGGLLCGDDISAAPVTAAVQDAVGEFESHGALWAWRRP